MGPLLLHPNEECVIEAARAFGNFSRDQAMRDAMTLNRVPEILIVLLDHQSFDVVHSVCGVLVNLAQDAQGKLALLEGCCDEAFLSCQDDLDLDVDEDCGGLGKLLSVFRSAGLREIDLAKVACMALANYTLPIPSTGKE